MEESKQNIKQEPLQQKATIVLAGMFKKQGTPLLLFSSDNIYGTQTSLTQLSAVKAKSSEKRGKIQTTKMTKFSNLFTKKGTQSTMTSYSYNWPQFLIRSRFTYPNDLPMTSNSLCKAVTNMFPYS